MNRNNNQSRNNKNDRNDDISFDHGTDVSSKVFIKDNNYYLHIIMK